MKIERSPTKANKSRSWLKIECDHWKALAEWTESPNSVLLAIKRETYHRDDQQKWPQDWKKAKARRYSNHDWKSNYIADADAVSQFRFVFSYANGNRKYASQAITKNDSHENEIRQSMQIKLTLYYAIHSYVSYKLLEITLKVFCITTGIILMHD